MDIVLMLSRFVQKAFILSKEKSFHTKKYLVYTPAQRHHVLIRLFIAIFPLAGMRTSLIFPLFFKDYDHYNS